LNEKQKELSDLHTLLARILAQQIKLTDENGKANGAILNVARAFLRDNGIDADVRENKELQILSEELPFDEDDTVVQFKRA
jgi:hypothetical protein